MAKFLDFGLFKAQVLSCCVLEWWRGLPFWSNPGRTHLLQPPVSCLAAGAGLVCPSYFFHGSRATRLLALSRMMSSSRTGSQTFISNFNKFLIGDTLFDSAQECQSGLRSWVFIGRGVIFGVPRAMSCEPGQRTLYSATRDEAKRSSYCICVCRAGRLGVHGRLEKEKNTKKRSSHSL